VQADDRVAVLLGDQRRQELVGRGRLGVAEIGRAEQAGRTPRVGFDQALRGVDLQLRA
jgi:hypothetical protein